MLSTCHAECVRVAVISRYACLFAGKGFLLETLGVHFRHVSPSSGLDTGGKLNPSFTFKCA